MLMRTVTEQFERYVKLSSKIPPEVLTSLSGIDDPRRLADSVAGHLNLAHSCWSLVLFYEPSLNPQSFLKFTE